MAMFAIDGRALVDIASCEWVKKNAFFSSTGSRSTGCQSMEILLNTWVEPVPHSPGTPSQLAQILLRERLDQASLGRKLIVAFGDLKKVTIHS